MAEVMGLVPLPGCVDGVFLTKPVEEILANNEGNKVPLLIGINNMEYGYILPLLYNLTGISGFSDGMTQERVMEALQNIPMLPLSNEVISMMVDEYIGDITDPMEIRDRFLDICGDAVFVMQALKFGKHHRGDLGICLCGQSTDKRGPLIWGVPVYFYEFQHQPRIMSFLRPKYVKCDHGDEPIFVFGGPFLRDGSFYSVPATPEERVLSKTVMKYWANFARTGNPNSPDLTTWLQYGTDEHYLGIHLEQKLSSKLKEEKFVFLDGALSSKNPVQGNSWR